MRTLIFTLVLICSGAALAENSPRFTLNSEDGAISYSCNSSPRPGGGPDWIVKCDDQTFAVHLLINKFPVRGGKLKYQILYWVLDYNDRPDSSLAGTYHGTNLSFVVEKGKDLEPYHIGQVVQTVWTLDLTLDL